MRTAMMAMTTNNSIKVKPRRLSEFGAVISILPVFICHVFFLA
jgi:hypothetical protein